ncbi:MAG: hypothetical protein PHD55_11855, partial [Methanoregula sp.]|nr:hypothetical protein [Methanoregula sp.]
MMVTSPDYKARTGLGEVEIPGATRVPAGNRSGAQVLQSKKEKVKSPPEKFPVAGSYPIKGNPLTIPEYNKGAKETVSLHISPGIPLSTTSGGLKGGTTKMP